jgi:uncharacterized protein
MKYSQFNSISFYREKYALYNSFNNKVIFLEEALKDILYAARQEGIDSLEQVHPTFYKYLIEQEFLIPDNENEIENLKKVSRQIDENERSFLLTINPSMNCNFKCWYCYETHVKDSSLNKEMINKINKFISNTARKEGMQYFSLAFFGGEPLLYFKRDVKPVINLFAEECHNNNLHYSISFTTNGYLINDDFISYFKEKKLSCSLQITLDGYKEEHDLVRFVSAKKGSYDEIINNVRLLLKNNFPVRLRINYTDKNLENTYKIAEEFSDIPEDIKHKYLLIDYHRVWQNDKVDDLHITLERNVNIMRKAGLQVLSRYSPNNVLNSCYADKRNSVVINYNGDIFKCTARDFTTVKRAGFLDDNGFLVWENDYLNKRMQAKFNNKPCLSCRITPLCNGGCSQHAMENLGGDDYCVYHGDEGEKDKIVKSKIEDILNEAVPA